MALLHLIMQHAVLPVTIFGCLYLTVAILFFMSSIMKNGGVEIDCPNFGRGIAAIVVAGILLAIAGLLSTVI